LRHLHPWRKRWLWFLDAKKDSNKPTIGRGGGGGWCTVPTISNDTGGKGVERAFLNGGGGEGEKVGIYGKKKLLG